MSSIIDHVFIASRCIHCNTESNDACIYEIPCIERKETVVYTTESREDRMNLFNKPYSEDPAYAAFAAKYPIAEPAGEDYHSLIDEL